MTDWSVIVKCFTIHVGVTGNYCCIRNGLFVIASEAKQSILPSRGEMDCFASLAMTEESPASVRGRRTPPPGLAFGKPDDRLQRGIQYAAAFRFNHCCLWNTGSPAFAGDDD